MSPGQWQYRKGSTLPLHTTDGLKQMDTPAHVVRVFNNPDGLRTTQFICTCNSIGLPNEENAQAIALLPELIAVARMAADECGGVYPWQIELKKRAEEVLAKLPK
jgi:hypothetical protein